MAEINLLDLYPRSKRPIEERAKIITEADRMIARKFGKDFFDGTRLHGYGGYYYDGRWKPIVQRFRDHYGLHDGSTVLDVGCAKGFLLHDFKEAMPGLTVAGIDISPYAIDHSMEGVKPFLSVGNARELPFKDHSFDLVISITTLHNLPLTECRQALREVQRVSGKHAFITLDAWRSDDERTRMLQWNITAQTFMHIDDWKEIFEEVGYDKDYYWFTAE